MLGLNNPRGLAFCSNGSLYAAEAGVGGDGPSIESPEGGESCLGLTGSVTRIANHLQERVITGLPSLAGEDGSFAIGPSDVIPQRRGGEGKILKNQRICKAG